MGMCGSNWEKSESYLVRPGLSPPFLHLLALSATVQSSTFRNKNLLGPLLPQITAICPKTELCTTNMIGPSQNDIQPNSTIFFDEVFGIGN